MNDSSQNQFLSSAEAARVLGVHAASLKRWSDQGRIDCVRTPGGHRRFRRADVERFAQPPAKKSSDECGFTKRLRQGLGAGDQPTADAVLLDHWGETGRWEHVGDDVGVMLGDWRVVASGRNHHGGGAHRQRDAASFSRSDPHDDPGTTSGTALRARNGTRR